MAGLAASSPLATTSSVGAVAPAKISLIACGVASASTIMIATSPSGRTRPATTMSKVARSSSSRVGKATHWPSTCATRVEPTGPLNGRPESLVDIEAPFMATTSYGWAGSSARIVSTTWTSLRSPLVNDGRSGRSIRRQVRIASSLGRPSRRKKEPGMRPAAYIRSSTSTVSGKKSKCSFGALLAVVAERTTVSPSRTITEPAACLARRPVEKVISRVPNDPLSMTAVRDSVPRAICSVMVLRYSFVEDPAVCSAVQVSRSSIEVPRIHLPGNHYRGPVLRGREPRGSVGIARGSGPYSRSPVRSSAQAETLDQRPVAGDVLLLHVVEQSAAAADQQQQATPAVVVVLVHLQVLGEVGDPLGQHRDLNLGRTGVAVLRLVLVNDLVLGLLIERHVLQKILCCRMSRFRTRGVGQARGTGRWIANGHVNPTRGSSEQRAGLFHILADLRDERFDA